MRSSDEGEADRLTDVGNESAHILMRFAAWLLRGESGDRSGLPVRVFYKFDSGCWRSRSTHQLHKVYRCR
jgi:hypothetical protein